LRKLEFSYLLLIEKSFEYYYYISQIVIFINDLTDYTYSIVHECSVYIHQKLLSIIRKFKQISKLVFERIFLPIYERSKPFFMPFLTFFQRMVIKISSYVFHFSKISIKVLVNVVYTVFGLGKFLLEYLWEKWKLRSFSKKVKDLTIYIITLITGRLIYLYNSKSMLLVYLKAVFISIKDFAILMIRRINNTLRQSLVILIYIYTTLRAYTLSFIYFLVEKSKTFYQKLKPKINYLINQMGLYFYKSFNYLTCFTKEIFRFLKVCLNYMALKFLIIYCFIRGIIISTKDLLKEISVFFKSKFDYYMELAKTLMNRVKNIIVKQIIIVRCQISEFLEITIQSLKYYSILTKEKIIIINTIIREYFSNLKNYLKTTIKEIAIWLKELIKSLKESFKEKILLIKALGLEMKLYIKDIIRNVKTNVKEVFSSFRIW
jgi:hypothetical protein